MNIQLNIRLIICAIFLSAFAISCSKSDITSGETEEENGNSENNGQGNSSTSLNIEDVATISTAKEGNTDSAYNADDLIENSSFTSTVSISFGTTNTITNPLAASGVSITETNGDVIITSTAKAVEYIVSGTTTNGSLKIYSDNKFKLTLNGVSITNNDGPAINIQSSKRSFIVLADNTTNTLTDGFSYATSTEDMKGTIFSEGQMIFSGNGTLNVKGNYKHGIVSDDYVRVRSGNINITGAATDGIHTNDAFIADGGTLNIKATSDGIECEEGYIVINDGSFTLQTGDDGIAASYDTDATIDPYVTINGGTFNITTTSGEGIESKSTLTLNNGTLVLKTYDDGLNAGKALYINGGTTYVYSSNNDGIDSNGILTITGGKTVSVGAGSPEEGFDCDNNTFKITGGIIVGIGGATSMPTANVSTQRSVRLGGASASQLIHIEATDGSSEALTFTVPRTYTTLLFSSPKLKASTSYTVYTGGAVTGGTNLNGLYTSGSYMKGSAASGTTFTTSSMVTSAGGSAGPGGGR
ncbi:carbohydrate-binding domain-containing protein [Niabella hibiscisoli]|uniref:carbohydrate-binding domain-containing protein n=1 Tax=Niabella hibiscisoli TaxID=1825928 RepID=UPI001F10FEB2|nr:carbohydrate-binding domain-containing protein [Niabella hibiscisoli]MCH5717010.1 carbohydrate-binding domain-containing protein [Niabella hibiscisoli]